MAAKKTPSGVYVLLIVAFALLTVGMGLDGPEGLSLTALAILLFIVGIILSLVGARAKEDGPPPPAS